MQEVCGSLSHPSVNVGLSWVSNQSDHLDEWYKSTHLRSFDVVVEVVAEGLDVRNVLVTALRSQVTREKDFSVSYTATTAQKQTYQM